MTKLIYREGGIELVLARMLANVDWTVGEMLDFCNLDMDEVANKHGWDGWSFEALTIEKD